MSVALAMKSILHIEIILLREDFSAHGSIIDDAVDGLPLYSDTSKLDAAQVSVASKYRIEPTVNREWWRGAYVQVPGSRGPCRCPLFYRTVVP